MDPKSKIIFITGTSRGIGRYLAEFFCAGDYFVIGCSKRNENIFSSKNYRHLIINLDKQNEILEAFLLIKKEYGHIDILINNAAINPKINSLIFYDLENINNLINVNLIAPILCMREASKLMIKNKWGRIINIGSMATRHEVQGEGLYTASKAGLHALTRVGSKELSIFNITCNTVAPSAVDTNLIKKIDRIKLNEVIQRNAIQQFDELSDIANIVNFLIGDSAKSITGQIIFSGGA